MKTGGIFLLVYVIFAIILYLLALILAIYKNDFVALIICSIGLSLLIKSTIWVYKFIFKEEKA